VRTTNTDDDGGIAGTSATTTLRPRPDRQLGQDLVDLTQDEATVSAARTPSPSPFVNAISSLSAILSQQNFDNMIDSSPEADIENPWVKNRTISF